MENLFKETQYREFLKKCFPGKGELGGKRGQLAKALGCQTSFISLVLTDRAHFNEDMLFRSAQFLGLNSNETDFLLLIYHFERANSQALRGYYQRKINERLEKRQKVKEKVGPSAAIPIEIQALYYSNWTYAAIHTVVMNPQTRTIQSISKRLNLPSAVVEEHLQFLEAWSFVTKRSGQYEPGVKRIHIDSDSPFIVQHHRNWHLEAMRALGEKREHDLNYSGALSMSKADAAKVKELLLNAIGAIEKQIRPSADEETVGLTLSYFRY
jgi:uncharacterized protein (TIGR02147 family)